MHLYTTDERHLNYYEVSKRPWHTPELRKNTIQEDTEFGPAIATDGPGPGTSSPPD